MKKVLLDTNFLIDIVRFRIGLEEIERLVDGQYKLLTLDRVMEELKSIGNKNAEVALKLVEVGNIGIVRAKEKNVDKALIDLADKDTIVATNDIILREKLKALGSNVIYLRAKKHLAIS
jgi:rRNA-processing protein FCF1